MKPTKIIKRTILTNVFDEKVAEYLKEGWELQQIIPSNLESHWHLIFVRYD